ncbi:dGTP triphosphohydrolase [Magnetospirillum fulvum]|uniref:dGTPase n=1 Tax=Magnetospirillum fulvum TaxID=1082 RepID=A0A1H6GUA6_MAGFU|nr:dNTP triphosphohydrolase [Magnetospirillum fulvum]SEH25728.1 dGTPase [Magnetospirillum fulvum]
MSTLKWENLLSCERRRQSSTPVKDKGSRTEIERDFDRILFSAPVRRLADKTQVFPLEKNDSVRTRLTHSHEVANLARSIGTHLACSVLELPSELNSQRNIPALLAAIGLAHDLGNPPFGHQGETAIQRWVKKNERKLFELPDNEGSFNCDALKADLKKITPAMRADFLKFDGNAQTFRLLTHLQIITDGYGLNLTYATLAALLKYTVPSDIAGTTDNKSAKKPGFFQSEADVVKEVWEHTGLNEGIRHPLTFIMEACDDIAYSVIDVEDAVKKGLVSFNDVIQFLQEVDDDVARKVVENSRKDFDEHRAYDLSPAELNDVSMQKFRVYAIGAMVGAIFEAFSERQNHLLDGYFKETLMGVSKAKSICKSLKNFALERAYRHRSVLKIELEGAIVIEGLMDMLWEAVTNRTNFLQLNDTKEAQSRTDPFANYVYGRISENYRRAFVAAENLPIRYREIQLVIDMVSGMTDSYALNLYRELKALHGRELRAVDA